MSTVLYVQLSRDYLSRRCFLWGARSAGVIQIVLEQSGHLSLSQVAQGLQFMGWDYLKGRIELKICDR